MNDDTQQPPAPRSLRPDAQRRAVAGHPRRRAWVGRVGLWLGACLLLLWVQNYAALSVPNERSRIYLAVAMVDHGTVAIDAPIERWGALLDAARHGGHFFSDKAPGSSLLYAGLYAGLKWLASPGGWDIDSLLLLARWGLMVPLALLGCGILLRLLEHLGVASGARDFTAICWLFASSAWHYSAAFYGHQIVAVALLAVLLSLTRAAAAPGLTSSWVRGAWSCSAGAALCLALLTEYQAWLLVVPLLLFAAFMPRVVGRAAPTPGLEHPTRTSSGAPPAWGSALYRVAALVAAVVVSGVALGAYHARCFGSPWEVPYHHLADAQLRLVHSHGLAGVTGPHWEALVGSLFSWHRGLLATSPWLVAAIVGVRAGWRAGARAWVLLLASGSGAFLLFVFSSNMWVAGWAYGPRLLVPVMPWLALLVGLSLRTIQHWGVVATALRGAALASLLQYAVVLATFPEPPPEAVRPLAEVALPLLGTGAVAPNLGQCLGLGTGPTSLAPFAVLLAGVAILLLRRRWSPAHSVSRSSSGGASLIAAAWLALQLAGSPGLSGSARGEFLQWASSLSERSRCAEPRP